MIELAAIQLVTFHTVDGREVQVNPMAVQQLVHPSEPRHTLIIEGVHCIIMLAGSFVSVTETCEDVQQRLEGEP
jgi:hypothetical protein